MPKRHLIIHINSNGKYDKSRRNKIEHLTNFKELADFYTGKKQMDVWPMYKTIWPEE